MGQLAREGGVDFSYSSSFPSREEDSVAYLELVDETLALMREESESSVTLFDAARNVAKDSGEDFTDKDRALIVKNLVGSIRQHKDDRLEKLCDLIDADQISEFLGADDELRNQVISTLFSSQRIDSAQSLSNQLIIKNTDREKLRELLLILPDNYSEEAWKAIGRTLGLGPMAEKDLKDTPRKITLAFQSLMGSKKSSNSNNRPSEPSGICLSPEDAKWVIFRVLSLPSDQFERMGERGTWDRSRETLNRIINTIEKLGWERHGAAGYIPDADLIESRRNTIRNTEGFSSLFRDLQIYVLSCANQTGPLLKRSVRDLIERFARGYQEEEIVVNLIKGYQFTRRNNVLRAEPGSPIDQFGYDVFYEGDPDYHAPHVYFDVKINPKGVAEQKQKNERRSGQQHLPHYLQAIPCEGNKFRVVLRAYPVTIRDENRELVPDPVDTLFRAIRSAGDQLNPLLIAPAHSTKRYSSKTLNAP